MAIKTLRFSFDIPIADVLGLVAMRNESLHIDVIGDGKQEKIPKQLRNGVAGLLAGPTKRGSSPNTRGQGTDGKPITCYLLIAKAMLAAPDQAISASGLREPLTAAGLNPKSISPQMSVMVKEGHAKRIGFGAIKMTPQGARHFTKMLKDRDEKYAAATP